ncbi:MAG: hypothetical protein JW795_17165 [Chitinivibrionales bacterium]|nr:hypothetical protein [Chitinivibrionales bacterium]
MVTALFPSWVNTAALQKPYPTVLAFLTNRFPAIGASLWRSRIEAGRVLSATGAAYTDRSMCEPFCKIFYFREVEQEPVIPFQEQILLCDDHLLAAYKPHFLPVIPSGKFVNECLLYRLRNSTGIDELVPLHRIDKETAGVVLFSTCSRSRGAYQSLFATKQIHKVYEAVCNRENSVEPSNQEIRCRLVKGEPWFRMKVADSGEHNSRTTITFIAQSEEKVCFSCEPRTGRKHQIRVHLSSIGYPILNDPFYPELQAQEALDFTKPLQLLAKRIMFLDPLSRKPREFIAPRSLF